MRNGTGALRLFEGFGVELEYMVVSRDSLKVLPVVDELLRDVAGAYVNEVETGPLVWSNELVRHVVELKTNGPASSLPGIEGRFQSDIDRINGLLAPRDAMLLPGGMHPFMNPARETHIWKRENKTIYNTYHRIFNCRSHGWANLQSVHLNLPFGDDDEFGRLHAAVRVVLPLLPVIAAGSPVMEGEVTGFHDTRLEVYRQNQKLVPSIAGQVIPEAVFTEDEYQEKILAPMYRDISRYDPKGVLGYEWLNSRGAIARFDRNTIEIRLLDIQEYPFADCAVAAFTVAMIRALTSERLSPYAVQRNMDTAMLHELFLKTIRYGGSARVDTIPFLELFGWREGPCCAGDLMNHLYGVLRGDDADLRYYDGPLSLILSRGPLASRIIEALAADASRGSIMQVYRELAGCLHEGRPFLP
ncbi:MAG TPA: glutamate-cysteine ligase family protein [Spirochaetota bacterium]|nr:glutamate-cysteine ligase family protein [Spirochaetota bacterium]